jgi:CRISPR/Cas system CSM-associated protein Csm2 small subunit
MMLSPNQEQLNLAYQKLIVIFRDGACVEALLSIIMNESELPLRQISSVYLRQVIGRLWPKLTKKSQLAVKDNILKTFHKETIPIMQSSIAEAMGALSKILIPNKEWNEIIDFILKRAKGNEPEQIQGLMLLSVIIEYLSKDDIKNLYDKIHQFIYTGLQHKNKDIKLFSIKASTNIAKTTQNVKVLKNFQTLIPLIL